MMPLHRKRLHQPRQRYALSLPPVQDHLHDVRRQQRQAQQAQQASKQCGPNENPAAFLPRVPDATRAIAVARIAGGKVRCIPSLMAADSHIACSPAIH
jgi:hypothetical protein